MDKLTPEEIIWISDKTYEFSEYFAQSVEKSDIKYKIKDLITDKFFDEIRDNCANYFQDVIREEAHKLVRNILAGNNREYTDFILTKYRYNLLPEIRKNILNNEEFKKQMELCLSYDDYKDEDWISADWITPEPRVHVRALLTPKDDSYIDPDDGYYLYNEIDNAWFEKGEWHLSLPNYLNHCDVNDYKIIWWQYKAIHPKAKPRN